MTAADDATITLAGDELTLDEPGVTLARDTIAQVREIGAMISAAAEWAAVALAGGAPPKWVAYQLILADRLIARAARGEAVTL